MQAKLTQMKLSWWNIALLIVILVGIGLRIFKVPEIPPGLYRDEAYTGMDSQETLDGDIRMYYDSSFGREPLFTWLVALSISIWGSSPFATRFPSLIVGVLTLFTLYGMTHELYGKRTALLATAVLAITLWHVHFSRVSFRAVMIPLFSSLSVWQVAQGIRTQRRLHWMIGGAAAGVLLYTYISARLAPLPVFLFLVYLLTVKKVHLDRQSLQSGIVFLIAAAAVMAPLIIYTVLHWDEVFLRVQNVESIFNMEKPVKLLFQNFLGALGMFFIRGDFQYRHNVPLRPVFDPLMAIMFCIGLWLTIRAFKKKPAAAFLLIWIPCLLIPTILTKDSPHFIRSIGILPFIAILPALGLEWTWDLITRRAKESLAILAVIGILCVSLGSTIHAYFIRFPSYPETCYWFECAGTELASEINTYLGTGWTKGHLIAQQGPARTDRQVLVQHQLWKDFVNAHYLIPDSPAFNVPGYGAIESTPLRPDLPTLFFGWYNKQHLEFWVPDLDLLPPNSLIEVQEGPWATTHQDWTPHPAYLKFTVTPTEPPDTAIAQLDNGIQLVAGCTVQDAEGITLKLIWYNQDPIEHDYKVFVHYERDGQVIAQDDTYPASGYHKTTDWRPGDQLVDEHWLPITQSLETDRIWAGMYLDTGERLTVTQAVVPTEDDRIAISQYACDKKW